MSSDHLIEEASTNSDSFLRHPLVVLSVVALSGCLSTVALGPSLAVACLWAFYGRRRFQFLGGLLLAGLFLLCATRAMNEIQAFNSEYRKSRAELGGPKRCAGTFTVLRSPTLRSDPKEEGGALTLWSGETNHLDCEGRSVNGPIRVRLYGGPQDLARGDQVEVIAKLAPTRIFRNSGLANPVPGAARRGTRLSGSAVLAERISEGTGMVGMIDRARAWVRSRIVETYSPRVSSLGRALVLGENDLDQDDADAFRNSGLLHLLAVSGTHLVIAVFALVQGARAILVRIGPLVRRCDPSRLSSFMGALLSLLYADFSGGSGSAWRAAFMLCVVCGARSIGLRIKGPAALGASLLIGLAIDPLAGFDFSFLLSALATAGLIGIGQPLSRIIQRGIWARAPLRPIALSFVATVSSTIPCAPVLAMMDGSMTLAALFANVVAGPLGEIIALPACLLHAISSPFPPVEQGLALIGSGALYGVRAVALWSASVESAQFAVPFPSAWRISLLICSALTLAALGPSLKRLLTAGPSLRLRPMTPAWLLLALLLIGLTSLLTVESSAEGTLSAKTSHEDDSKGRFTVTALDVGQGDALFLDFPDDSVGLIDGGGFATGVPDTGSRVLLPYLRSRGVNYLDLIILSHAHPDHMNGLISLVQEVNVGELWIPHKSTRSSGPLHQLISGAERGGTRVRIANELCALTRDAINEGKTGFSLRGLRAQVFAPCEKHSPPFGENDASLVIKMTYGARSALFTGDIEVRGEASLLANRAVTLDSDLLKVAHHGSHTSSSPTFLRAASPSFALISSGVRNRFDHPRKITLDNLSQSFDEQGKQTLVLRTDQIGSISWSTDGRQQKIRTFTGPRHPGSFLYL